MIQKTPLHFSEEQFDGFYQLSIFIDEEGLRLECEVPKQLKEAFEKREAVEEYMDLVTNQVKEKRFSLWAKGAVLWEAVDYLLYYETNNQGYAFNIELVDFDNNKIEIKGSSSKQIASSFFVSSNDADLSDVIDAPQDQGNKSFLEHNYLKNAYQKIVEAIEPVVVDQLLDDYIAILESGEWLQFGLVKINQNGMYLKQPGWLFSKKVLVKWPQIKIGRDANAYHFSDVSNAKRKIVVAKSKLENIGLLLKLIQWGKTR